MSGASDIQVQVLRQALDRGESIWAVHYASHSLYKAKNEPVPVTCISATSVNDHGSNVAFSISDIRGSNREDRESELLDRFFTFLDEHQDAKLLHWNMDKADYGFESLANRYKWLTGKEPQYRPPSDRLFDLDQIITEQYGEAYVPHPKFRNLVALNKVSQRYWISGQDEAEKAEKEDYAAIQRSTSEKARAIAQLFSGFMGGSLVTSGSAGSVEFAGAQIDAVKLILQLADRMLYVERSLKKRHSQRPTLEVTDEYDVQDLLRSLLVLFFEDVREETWSPEYAGGSSRIDFTVPDYGVAIEVKKSRESMTARSVGEELLVDRDKYAVHPNVSHLVCVVMDHDGRLSNPRGLERDLMRESAKEGIAVTVRIVDR
ncbi:hypothetical protein ACIBJI_35165 [Nocardia sp. NPDC050408]|uniref:PD-(D/E)XK nuclease domain-containing protein n=1 Tax=Nocardia sp. NPDC050408 TaxID=3364319 RepID=UPI0037BCB780